MKKRNKQISAVEIRKFGPKTNMVFNILIGIFAISCIVPFFFILVLSLTKESDISLYGYRFWPDHWSFESYEYLKNMGNQVVTSFGVSIFVTVVATVFNTLFTSCFAYAISRKSFYFRKFFTLLGLISMLFSAGMVPKYLIVTQMLHLTDSIWALIIPASFGMWNVLIMRTYYTTSIPESIIESAKMDGASEFRIFRSIVAPLSVPGLATISLFNALGNWNAWFDAMLYINDSNKIPLQYLLVRIQNDIQLLAQQAQQGGSSIAMASAPTEGMRFAVVVVVTLPILLTYPFFQKYFVKGMTIGGVKG